MQVVFAIAALVGSVLLYRHHPVVAGPMIVLGLFALLFSFLIFGGIVGALGGILSVAAGALAWPRATRVIPPYPFPPPYPGPPYGPHP
jgi:hypothetical protein